MREEYRILSTTAILGYGFPLASFEAGMARKPHLIAVDAGSSDPGPYYLGAGESFTDRGAVKRDLEIMLSAAIEHDIPVVIGTAGGSGADAHLAWCREIIEEIARERDLHFPMAVIHAEIPREAVRDALKVGRVTPLAPAPDLTEAMLDETVCIVGQMGNEPIIRALDEGAQVVLAGRAYDPACFAAAAVRAGYDLGLATHLGKILECASIAATPGSGSDCMFGYLGEDYFRLEPLNPARKCTTISVAAHTLYEKTNPYVLPGPGGALDLTDTRFEQETDRIAKVTGSRFVPAERYTIKLEGARQIGYRTVSIAGVRDPIMMAQIDSITEAVRERVADNFSASDLDYHLNFTVYGRNGVMGALEPTPTVDGHELGIIIEAVADTQAHADTICAFARSTMLHYGYEGRRATAGNLAFPYSPSDFHAGSVFVFSLYHLIEVDDPCALFPIEHVKL
ncbi:DUF1446 domain-containing protein [Eubacteriales bacterium OttesenSCG-928-A19]|nr:DUF1446 domain-containing protein [Eubacteriales bacterium OttesenSCG-928-A19]